MLRREVHSERITGVMVKCVSSSATNIDSFMLTQGRTDGVDQTLIGSPGPEDYGDTGESGPEDFWRTVGLCTSSKTELDGRGV